MEDKSQKLIHKIQQLIDLELVCLLCFVADQHCCIIETQEGDLKNVQKTLALICADTFDLSVSVVHCDASTTCEEFGQAILVEDEASKRNVKTASENQDRVRSVPRSDASHSRKAESEGHIANVIITIGLNEASEQVQVQALELIRVRRMFSRTNVHIAPKNMLLISLQPYGSQRLQPFVNDHMFICHSHEDLPNKDYRSDGTESDVESVTSAIQSPSSAPHLMSHRSSSEGRPFINQEDIKELTRLTASVTMSPDIRAHIHDIVIYLRNHRATAGGVTATGTRHLNLLSRVLAPLHSLTFITPSLVALAARKIYPHRLVLMQPERERSMQWGSSLDAVTKLLRDVTVEDVIEEVLNNVESPL